MAKTAVCFVQVFYNFIAANHQNHILRAESECGNTVAVSGLH